MVDKGMVAKATIAVVCLLAFVFATYNLVELVRHNGLFFDQHQKKKLPKKDDLFGHLQLLDNDDLDRSSLLVVLERLLECSAFTAVQNLIRQVGYLPKIVDILDHPDKDVKRKTALLINNLCLNEANQEVLRECIPRLIDILSLNDVTSSEELFTAILCVITNLTTLNESHVSILQHLPVLYLILEQCDVEQIKLQILKTLVNISTNEKIYKSMLGLHDQLLHATEPYVGGGVNDTLVLRAVSCCANVLNYSDKDHQEFVGEKVKENFIKLMTHQNEDIRFQAQRCVNALRISVPPTA